MIFTNHFKQIAMRSMLLLVTALITLSVNAIPAKPGIKRLLTLTDGSTIEARLVGDEFGHYWLGTNGKAYRATNDGKTYQLVDVEQVKQQAQVRRAKANERRAKRMPGAKRAAGTSSFTGEKWGIIILVNFADDVKFQDGNDNAYFQRIANEENFNEGDFVGSVHDYFYKQSEEKFNLKFDVAGPYTLKYNMSHYGANDAQGNDLHPAEMVIEACKMANDDVDFSKYDWDGDDEVDQVFIIYAGKGANEGGGDNTIWPHEWTLSSANYYHDGDGPQILDNVTIDTYACGSELNGSGKICGIGTICHEFSHCLGYPDYYDTDYSGGQGMGWWDLMDSGSYNGGGYCPAGYTSYERWVAGWIEPVELTATTQVDNMKALQDEANAYIIYNEGNRNEFFLLENRQLIGWDRELPNSGLLILHCDYKASIWNNNEPNDDPDHQRMTWIPADNEYQTITYVDDDGEEYTEYSWEGMMTDTYPYINSETGETNNAFSAYTTPAARFYNKNSDGTYFMMGAVKNITQNNDNGGTVSFLYKSAVPMPEFSLAAGTYKEPQTVTINCGDETAIICYTTDGTAPTANSTVYSGPITIESTTVLKAVAIAVDGEASKVATAKYVIRTSTGSSYFRRATSLDDLVSGQRCIIACGEHNVAAGELDTDGNYLKIVEVEVADDIVTINDNVIVFTLSGDENQYAFQTDKGYLYAITTKKVDYSDAEKKWTIIEDNDGLIMKYSNLGRMFFNNNDATHVRFNVYDTTPTNKMLLANIYVETDETPTPPPTPFVGSGVYEQVTSKDMLEADRQYLIVSTNDGDYYAYNGFNSDKGDVGIVTLDNNCIDMNNGTNEAVPVKLSSPTKDVWTIYDTNDKAYLGAKNGDSKYLVSSGNVSSDYFRWTISIGNSNVATVKNKGKNSYLKFNYNNGSPLFRVYSSGQKTIMLYKEMPVQQEIGITTGGVVRLNDNGQMINDKAWFTIDGRKLSGKPAKKGVYIHNGQKRIVK